MEDKIVYEPKLLPAILSFYKVTKEVISEREKEKRMCVVAGGERQVFKKLLEKVEKEGAV